MISRYASVLMLALAIGLRGFGLYAPPVAGAAEPSEQVKLRTTYADELQRIETAHEAAVKAAGSAYVDVLNQLEKDLQKAGRLEPLLVVRQERKRFEADGVVRNTHLSVEVPELAQRQAAYQDTMDQLPLEKARRVITLMQQFDKALAALQGRLTTEGNINEALKVKEEREALAGRPEVTAAEFVLADAASRTPPPAATAQPEAAQEPEPAVTQRPEPTMTAAKKVFTGSDENRIKRRFNDVTELILDQKWDEACAYADPEFLKRRGTNEAKGRFRAMFPFLSRTENPKIRLGVDEVRVADDLTAMLIPRILVNNVWHTRSGVEWILTDGDWYLKMAANPGRPERLPPPARNRNW